LKRFHSAAVVVALLSLIAVLRTVQSYAKTAQAFDEPCHISTALEWLQKRTYTLDPVHPPLARIAIGIPLLLAGERYPDLSPTDPQSSNYNVVGNHIIYDSGHFTRNLALARSGMLPLLMLAIVLVFLWTRRLFGDLAGVLAAALFSTLPFILAFSGLAYTDMAACCMQFAAFLAFATWLEKPSTASSLLFGVATGFALLSKFTILLFFPVVGIALLLTKALLHEDDGSFRIKAINWMRHGTVAVLTAIVVLWGGYVFSLGHVRETMQLTPENMPSFQHFPKPIANIARHAVVSDWTLPAPALIKGIATAFALNKTESRSYELGKIKTGGWWYFFLVALACKTPIAFLILSMIGTAVLISNAREKRWQPLAPLVCAIGVLIATMGVSYDAGLRHVIVVLPLLAVVAGCGAAYLWQLGRYRLFGRAILLVLLAWQGFVSFSARGDYIAYFNEFAGTDPSKILVTGCDLDCGQDLYRLADVLRARHISDVNLAVWSSADLAYLGLPRTQIPRPAHPVTGWLAVSSRSLRMGDVFHQTYPPGSFAWLDPYQPEGNGRQNHTLVLHSARAT
jgi:hypothetical protein